MRMLIPMILPLILPVSVSAAEYTAPPVPAAGQALMPENTASFPEALISMLRSVMENIRPDLQEASSVSICVISIVLLVSLLSAFRGSAKSTANLTGTAAVAGVLLSGANSMILLAKDTLQQLGDYGKLLFPVMTGSLAAQGGVTASTGLYIGTAFFDMLLGSLLTDVIVPFVYVFMAAATAGCVCGQDVLKRIRDMIKNGISWILKTVLTVFTTYMSITGVVSGTTDAAALKATKVTISSVVPVVGGILSDASEAVLVGAGIMKNAAGVYGILAVLALFLGPFVRIGTHYLLLKTTAAVCGLFGSREMTDLVGDFSTAMGILLAATGSMCLLLLISTVCFMKGVA